MALWVNSFWGNQCLYLPSRAHGKSAPVWRDSLRSDCALDCLICVEVAVDLKGPLLLWSWDPVWNFSSLADRDWHESDLRMFYSVSSPLSLNRSISRPRCGFPLIRKLTTVSGGLFQDEPEILSWTLTKEATCTWSDKWKGLYDILKKACCHLVPLGDAALPRCYTHLPTM